MYTSCLGGEPRFLPWLPRAVTAYLATRSVTEGILDSGCRFFRLLWKLAQTCSATGACRSYGRGPLVSWPDTGVNLGQCIDVLGLQPHIATGKAQLLAGLQHTLADQVFAVVLALRRRVYATEAIQKRSKHELGRLCVFPGGTIQYPRHFAQGGTRLDRLAGHGSDGRLATRAVRANDVLGQNAYIIYARSCGTSAWFGA